MSRKKEHTLGPWTIREPNGAGHGFSIPEIGSWFGTMAWEPETMANARLCAAAPDLLEALEGLKSIMIEWHDDHPDDIGDNEYGYLDKSIDAIAKARGEA